MAEQIAGTLVLSILRASNLINKDGFGQGVSDPFVTITATAGTQNLPKQQTTVKDDNLNPVWNERFYFVVDGAPSVTFKFEVWDKDPITDDLLGTTSLEVFPAFPWNVERNLPLTPPSKEKVSSAGELVIQFEYAKGEKVVVDANNKPKESQKTGIEALTEFARSVEEKRLVHDVWTAHEEQKMALLNKIYESNHNHVKSDILGIREESKLGFIKYQQAQYQVDETNHTWAKWERMMKKSDGAFYVTSQRIIEDILRFQADKKARPIRAGYLDDPENLFCEEIKNWAATFLCTLEMSRTAQDKISERIAYLEEVLLTPNLFDNPSTLGEATIQQVIVNTRRKLKYQLLAEIEKELASENAVRAFDDIRKHCSIVIYNCYNFLAHVFRAEIEGQVTAADKLLKTLQEDPNLKNFMGDSLTEVMDSINGVRERSEKYTFDLRENGLKPVLNFLDVTTLDLDDPLLPQIFVGPYSGVEGFFQGNAYITYKFLRAHALLLEFGRLFVVIEKARNCAKQGGTLLVYGVANAQLNVLLDSTKSMINAIRDEFLAVCKIAECAFEKLVFDNEATPQRSKWIKHFKFVFPAINKITEAVKQVLEDVGMIKLQANSMTLYERFQKAQNDTQDFLSSADSFSQRTAQVLGQPYEKPKISEDDLQKQCLDNNDVLLQKISGGNS
jgi:hypothetical protein